MNNKMTVLVMAFDSYSDVWKPFEFFMKKNWSDCEYPVVMATCNDTKGIDIADKIITTGNLEWTARLHKALLDIDTPYILMMLEDLYIDRKIQSEKISDCIALMERNEEIGHIRLLPNTKYKKNYDKDGKYGEYLPGQMYRISTHPAIWKREYLLKLTEPVMSAWDFEYLGSEQCCELPEKVLCTKETVLHFTNSVWRSKWTSEGVKLCKKNNIELDFNKRPHYTFIENVGVKTKTILYHILGPDISSKLVLKNKELKKKRK